MQTQTQNFLIGANCWGDILTKIAKDFVKIIKSTFFGQNSEFFGQNSGDGGK